MPLVLGLLGVPVLLVILALTLMLSDMRDQPLTNREGPAERQAVENGASVSDGAVAAASVAPPTPWVAVDPALALTQIAIGSCLSQRHPQPIWDGVLSLQPRPDLFLMVGDNVYGDIRSPDLSELRDAYLQQWQNPEFARARAALPFLATWDDHDYGVNDGGGDFRHKTGAARLFREFWQLDTGRHAEEGLYYARMFGPEDRRVQIVFLDTRFFRGSLRRKSASFPHWGKYEPNDDASQTMLGEAQWAWLDAQLVQPADLRIIVSSVQVLAEGHGFERWGNLPHERSRLMTSIENRSGGGVVFVSGDRHMAALYEQQGKSAEGPGIVPELTTSSMNRSYGPGRDAETESRVTKMFHQENFGVVSIDWERKTVTLSLKGREGQDLVSRSYGFKQLE